MMQRECPFCGATIPRAARTCAICGRAVPEAEPVPDVAAAPVSSEPVATPPFLTFESSPEKHGAVGHSLAASIFDASPSRGNESEMASIADETVESAGAVETENGLAANEKETELVGLVALYAVVGGYSGALIGLFAPLIHILAYSFTSDGFGEWLLFIFVIGVLGSIIWIPLSIIIAIIIGIGGLLLGLGVGIVAAILFRLTIKNSQSYQAGRVLVAILNAGVFGYAAYWVYTDSFMHRTFPELTALPLVFGLLGALSGLAMALVSPEKSEDSEPLTDEEAEEAKQFITAPFRLWRNVAGRAGSVSYDTIDDALRSQYDTNHPGFQDKEMKRISREIDREMKEMKKAEERMKEQKKRWDRGDFR